jgi:alkylated DNA repair protein alkB family protein 4
LGKTLNPSAFNLSEVSPFPDKSVVRIPLPPRSLLVMYGQARYCWEHMVLRSDISERRVVIAYRELTPPYLPGGEREELGREILERAELFW